MRYLYLLLLLFVLGCNTNDDLKVDDNPSTDNFSENFGEEINSDFLGRVVDINGLPISDVDIKIGSSTTRTDQNGVFIIKNATVFEKFAYITSTKTGYISGSRTLVPNNGTNHVEIMMISSAPISVIQSGQSSEVALSNGTKVIFDGAFEDLNGNTYTGSVSVSMFHLLTSDENLASLMPGSLYAQDSEGEQQMLQTFGMLNVELKGNDGQKLQIADGHQATMRMKIDDSQMTIAPQTIPLWSFDEEKGYWIEEGVAEKQGNYYEGKVSHFSWWNCDAFMELAYLTVKLTDSDSNPINNVKVKLTVNSNNFTSNYQNTNNLGLASGQIPADEVINVKVLDICDNLLYNQNVGPFSSNTNNLHEIVLNNSDFQSIEIVGSLINCESSPVTNGYVNLEFENQILTYVVNNGNFNFNTIVCNSQTQSFVLEGFDFDNLQSSGEINYSFTSLRVDTGQIPVCNSISEFILFKVNNDPINLIVNNLETFFTNGSNEYPYIIRANHGLYSLPGLSLSLAENEIGEYAVSSGQFSIGLRHYFGGGNVVTGIGINNSVTNPCIQIATLQMNSSPEIGEYYDATFTGYFTNPSNNPCNSSIVTGVIHVLRDQ